MSSECPNNSSPQPVFDGLFSEPEWNSLIEHLSLPERQTEILTLLLLGESDKEIAQKLAISVPTIRTHLQRIYRRLGVSNRTSLVVEVFRQFRAL